MERLTSELAEAKTAEEQARKDIKPRAARKLAEAQQAAEEAAGRADQERARADGLELRVTELEGLGEQQRSEAQEVTTQLGSPRRTEEHDARARERHEELEGELEAERARAASSRPGSSRRPRRFSSPGERTRARRSRGAANALRAEAAESEQQVRAEAEEARERPTAEAQERETQLAAEAEEALNAVRTEASERIAEVQAAAEFRAAELNEALTDARALAERAEHKRDEVERRLAALVALEADARQVRERRMQELEHELQQVRGGTAASENERRVPGAPEGTNGAAESRLQHDEDDEPEGPLVATVDEAPEPEPEPACPPPARQRRRAPAPRRSGPARWRRARAAEEASSAAANGVQAAASCTVCNVVEPDLSPRTWRSGAGSSAVT